MEQHPARVLRHVFISYKDNQLQLADVFFDDRIKEIRPVSDRVIDLKDIQSPQNWEIFKQQMKTKPGPIPAGEIDGECMLLIPGAIDAHVHFNTPGYEDREDFEHGSLAAAAGGVTMVMDMPCTSVPPVDSVHHLERKREALRERSLVDYAFWGGISGQMFSDPRNLEQTVDKLSDAGVVGFKSYFLSGMPDFSDLTVQQMQQAAMLVKKCGKILAVHAEDKKLVLERQKKFQQQQKNDWQAYWFSRDIQAERTAITNLVKICQKTGCRIHIVHISSAAGVELVRQAKSQGLPMSAETCPHYLHFTKSDFENPAICNYLKTAPPVKDHDDKEALWSGLSDGTLSFVTTDHAGCDPAKEKTSDNFWEVYGGIPGVEHRVAFLFSEGLKKGQLTLQQTVSLLAENPAQSFAVSAQKGFLKTGYDADFALINLWTEQKVSADLMHSKGKYTPFEGQLFTAAVNETYLRGNCVYTQGQRKVEFGYGQWIKPN